MKQVIVVSLVFFIFVLGGCKKENDCKEKGADWVWDVTKKECVITSKKEDVCKEKGVGWIWDTTKKECIYPVPPSAESSDKEKCEKKGLGYFWKESHPFYPNGACFWNIFKECRNRDPAKPLLKNFGDHLNNAEDSRLGKIPLECVARYITIINSTNRSIYVGNNYSKYGPMLNRNLYPEECTSVHKEEFDQLNYFRIGTSIKQDRTTTVIAICKTGGDAAENSSPCPSSEGTYEVFTGRSGFVVIQVDKTAEELNEMGCF